MLVDEARTIISTASAPPSGAAIIPIPISIAGAALFVVFRL